MIEEFIENFKKSATSEEISDFRNLNLEDWFLENIINKANKTNDKQGYFNKEIRRAIRQLKDQEFEIENVLGN